nr:unnamed protein product [Callosobruchus chinensis]
MDAEAGPSSKRQCINWDWKRKLTDEELAEIIENPQEDFRDLEFDDVTQVSVDQNRRQDTNHESEETGGASKLNTPIIWIKQVTLFIVIDLL